MNMLDLLSTAYKTSNKEYLNKLHTNNPLSNVSVAISAFTANPVI
jgi:hypothetical protein